MCVKKNGDDNKSKRCAGCNATIHNTQTYCDSCKRKAREQQEKAK